MQRGRLFSVIETHFVQVCPPLPQTLPEAGVLYSWTSLLGYRYVIYIHATFKDGHQPHVDFLSTLKHESKG